MASSAGRLAGIDGSAAFDGAVLGSGAAGRVVVVLAGFGSVAARHASRRAAA